MKTAAVLRVHPSGGLRTVTPKELRSYRLELGITLRELGEAAGVPPMEIAAMEHGARIVDRAIVAALRKLDAGRRSDSA